MAAATKIKFNIDIDRERLGAVMGRASLRRQPGEARVEQGRGRGKPSHLSAEVLAETRVWKQECKCDQLGLQEGMHADDLVELGSGCTGETPYGEKGANRVQGNVGHVCPRLDAVRRRYGR